MQFEWAEFLYHFTWIHCGLEKSTGWFCFHKSGSLEFRKLLSSQPTSVTRTGVEFVLIYRRLEIGTCKFLYQLPVVELELLYLKKWRCRFRVCSQLNHVLLFIVFRTNLSAIMGPSFWYAVYLWICLFICFYICDIVLYMRISRLLMH